MCNIDLVGAADLHFNFLNRFPLPDGVSEFVYCEHALEHFHIDHVRHVLSEVHRILAPGGTFRISVPRVSAPSGSPRQWDIDGMEGPALLELNRRVFGHEHKSIHSPRLLQHLLREAGFAETQAVREGESVYLDPSFLKLIESRLQGNVVVEARRHGAAASGVKSTGPTPAQPYIA
jgi:predicted SAM-dependent methyltransferase